MRNSRKSYNKNVYLIFIIFISLLMAIGYASVNSISLEIDGDVIAYLYEGSLIDDSANTTNLRYEYGSGIMNSAPTSYGSYLSSLGTWASNTFVKKSVTGNKETVTLTFKATGSTAYWVWNMANCKDSVDNHINIKVTNFSVTHSSGGKMNYYSSGS